MSKPRTPVIDVHFDFDWREDEQNWHRSATFSGTEDDRVILDDSHEPDIPAATLLTLYRAALYAGLNSYDGKREWSANEWKIAAGAVAALRKGEIDGP